MHIQFIYHFVTKTFCFSPEEQRVSYIKISISVNTDIPERLFKRTDTISNIL